MRRLISCINGRFIRADRATIPANNRGFRFGDGIFETIRIEQGVPYQWALHLARMADGLAALHIAPPPVDWAATTHRLLRKNRAEEGFLRISISRNGASLGYFPVENGAFWVMEYQPARPLPTHPFTLWQSRQTRAPLSSLPGNHKLANALGSTLALLEAQANNCDEALQLTSNGLLACTASANLFWLKNRTLFTPSLASGCLNGTTRQALLRLAPMPIHEIDAEPAAIESADAVFITNSRLSVWPVLSLQPVGLTFNASHPVIHELKQILTNDRSSNINEFSNDWRNS